MRRLFILVLIVAAGLAGGETAYEAFAPSEQYGWQPPTQEDARVYAADGEEPQTLTEACPELLTK